MPEQLIIKLVRMDEANMAMLERKGVITRLRPSREDHRLSISQGTGKGDHIYRSDEKYGGHSLIRCAIDNPEFTAFATHPDNEEFLLLGGVGEKKLVLLVALINREEYLHKFENRTLSAADFIAVECVFNDPELSFFVMHKNFPHGECVLGPGKPSTFYVTESARLPLDKIPFGPTYEIILVR